MNYTNLAERKDAIPVVAKWYFDQWGERTGVRSVYEIRLRLRKYMNRDRLPLMLLAVDNNKTEEIVGTGQLKYYEMDIYPDREHWLGGIYVSPEHRGSGVAAGLISELVSIARSLGVKTLNLQTERTDGGVYADLGWMPVEQVTYRGMDVLVMEKDLGE